MLVFAVILALLAAININYVWHFSAAIFRGAPKAIEPPLSDNPQIEPDFLIIPSLGVKAPVKYVDQAAEPVFQKALEEGVAHYPKTALPGELGNVYIFGHSSDYLWSRGDYKTIFADLPKIKIGEKIWLSDSAGKAYVYKVGESFVAKSGDTHLLSQDTDGKKILTLQTSWPLGTAMKRWIVRAELEQN